MTHLDTTKKGQDEKTILRDVLHIIATHRDPTDCIPLILQIAQSVSGAVSAAFIIFNEPRLFIGLDMEEGTLPSHDELKSWVASFSEGVHLNPQLPENATSQQRTWLVAPVRVNQTSNPVGLLWLNFDSVYEPSEDDKALLLSLLDGLTIVTRHARSAARHERLNRNQNEFTRIVSHDLRSPLTAMKGFASMLETNTVGEMNERQAHFVEKILSGIQQMTSLVDNIQDAGRYDPETGFYEMQRSQCDLIEMAHRIVNNHLMPAEKGEVTIAVTASDDVPIIYADSNMLERALTNLVDNAIKYTPNGGKVEVGVRKQDELVLLSVTDTGYGISPENQKHLFERHVRIPRREHKKVKGSGLGLFIVRSVAQRHGGNAWVESSENQGSTFFMSIPLNGENLLTADKIEPQE
jgi:signal transduction histidine kinase